MNEKSAAFLAPALAQLAALALDPNITRAAARTGTSQPTLSRSLRGWEADLGISLVVRRGRGVQLSEDGQLLAAAAADSLHALDQALHRIRGTGQDTLRVGVLRSLGPTVSGDLIASFLAANPGIVIEHSEGSSADLVDGLGDGQVDIAITAPRPPRRFGWLPLGNQALVLVVPKGHRLAQSAQIDLAALHDEPFLVLGQRFDARQRADALCAAAGFSPRVVLEADNFMTVRGYVAAGLGVAILPADTSLSPQIASIPLSAPGARRVFGLCWDPDRVSAASRALAAHAEELNQLYPGWADLLA
jgi:LysR family transcriptional regulator, transcription activator of glutamate synthase operon